MTLRSKLIISVLTILLLTASLLVINSIMAKQEEAHVKRLLRVHHQFTTLLDLKIAVNRHLSESQAIFIYGKKTDPVSFTLAAEQVMQEFKNFGLAFTHEMSGLPVTEKQSEKRKIWLDKLQQDYNIIYRELLLMTKLIKLGRQAKAREHFRTVIAEKFAYFFSEIDELIVQEKQELLDIESSFIEINQRDNYSSVIGLAAIMAVVLIFSFFFFYVFGPRLRELLRGTERIAQGDFKTMVPVKGRDEFSRLSKSMNQMMNELAASRKKLLEQSYYSGMADMVAGTLHNLRNSLSPVVVDLESIGSTINQINAVNLKKAANELQDDKTDTERRRDLHEYIITFSQSLNEQIPKLDNELSEARKKIDVIEKVLNEHSRLVDTERPLEEISIQELVQDGLGLVRPEYLERVELQVEDMAAVGSIKTQRIVMVQVIANLVNNGIESIVRLGRSDGQIIISAAYENQDNQKILHVQVVDNGEGIESDMLKKIFQRGISAKDENSGLGLHWCANSVSALDGLIYAESSGVGHGAILHVCLRCHIKKSS